MKCVAPKAKDADPWTLIREEAHRIHQEGSAGSRACQGQGGEDNMTLFEHIYHRRNERADELAKDGVMMDGGEQAHIRANTVQQKEKRFTPLQYAASSHCSVKVHDCEEVRQKQNMKFLDEKWKPRSIARSGVRSPRGTRRGTATETVEHIASGIQSPGRMESGKTRTRKRYRRCDTANRGCLSAGRFGGVQRRHPLHCRGAGCSTPPASGIDEDTSGHPGFG